MKSIKFLTYSLFTILTIVSLSCLTQSCNSDDCDDEEETCDTCIVAYKPNIYLYPEKETFLKVELSFPKGGGILTSIPEYGNGWSVSITPDGKINQQYDFLFYESEQPNVWQTQEGWCVKKQNLTEFFSNNLTDYGFTKREIEDFNAYWIPRLQNADFYVVFPQTKERIEQVIEMSLSETPDNFLRLFYLIHESGEDISEQLETPVITNFYRSGFVVTEWGVIL